MSPMLPWMHRGFALQYCRCTVLGFMALFRPPTFGFFRCERCFMQRNRRKGRRPERASWNGVQALVSVLLLKHELVERYQ